MSKKEDSQLINTKVKGIINRINTVVSKVEGASKFSDLENMELIQKKIGMIKYIGYISVDTAISGNSSGYIKITSEAMYFNGKYKTTSNTYKLDLATWTLSKGTAAGQEAESLGQSWSSPYDERILPEPFTVNERAERRYFLSCNNIPQVLMVYIPDSGGDQFNIYRIF